MRQFATVAVVLSLGIASQAAAADVSSAVLATNPGVSDSSVLVNHDGKFASVLGAHSVLKTGDRVVMRDGASGSLTFADGCVVHLAPGAMATIGAASPCAKANGGYQQVAWDSGGAGTGYVLGALAVGGLVAVGLGFGGVFNHHDHHPQPVSP